MRRSARALALALALCALAQLAAARAVVREALEDGDDRGGMAHDLRLAASATASGVAAGGVWVVSGATGRTGLLAYQALQSAGNVEVRALVRNSTKAKMLLSCGNCTERDGVFVGDVRSKKSLQRAMKGADGLVIVTSAIVLKDGDGHYYFPSGAGPKDIDWRGTVNQVEVAKASGVKHIMLVSAMGTTVPDGALDKVGSGHMMHYKLNAEALLMQSGVTYSIIKPCGLTNEAMHMGTQVGHCDNFKHLPIAPLISRATIASYIRNIASQPGDLGKNVRFVVCSDPLRPFAKDDMSKLLAKAADISDC